MKATVAFKIVGWVLLGVAGVLFIWLLVAR